MYGDDLDLERARREDEVMNMELSGTTVRAERTREDGKVGVRVGR